MERKDFLVKASLAAFAVSACGTIKPTKEVEGERFIGSCATTNDILGPFYRNSSPSRSDLTFEGIEGSIVEIKGRILGPDCVTPLENATVEIWHCDTEGRYDNDTDRYDHRGQQKTNKAGEYSFKTILPGKYLNGELYRPAHIHFRVTAPDHQSLVSQMYFMGDPHIEKDPWASLDKAKARIVPIVLEDVKGNVVANFDVFLTAGSDM